MKNPSSTQLAILNAAAARQDHAIEPLPPQINAGIRPTVISALLKHGWAEEENGQLKMTAQGWAVLPKDAAEEPPEGSAKTPQTKKAEKSTPQSQAKKETKQALMIAMLRRPEGATVEAIAQATGWKTHTVRGVFAGTIKKRLGYHLTSHKAEGQPRHYRIEGDAS